MMSGNNSVTMREIIDEVVVDFVDFRFWPNPRLRTMWAKRGKSRARIERDRAGMVSVPGGEAITRKRVREERYRGRGAEHQAEKRRARERRHLGRLDHVTTGHTEHTHIPYNIHMYVVAHVRGRWSASAPSGPGVLVTLGTY